MERSAMVSSGIVGFYLSSADHVKGTECLRPLEHWDRGLESHSGHGCTSSFLAYFPYFQKIKGGL
jgi:hypothetical protein